MPLLYDYTFTAPLLTVFHEFSLATMSKTAEKEAMKGQGKAD
jgi:hypothetical protein